jgi:hypothetical protein
VALVSEEVTPLNIWQKQEDLIENFLVLWILTFLNMGFFEIHSGLLGREIIFLTTRMERRTITECVASSVSVSDPKIARQLMGEK